MLRTSPKAKGTYHHGDLENALIAAALETIREDGVEALTLRVVADKLAVSRTALYRHFDGKAALLARVASEGFRLLRDTLASAVANSTSERGDRLQIMCAAYIHFASANPSHYETMFGVSAREWSGFPEVIKQAEAAFGVFVDAIRSEQGIGRMSAGDAVERAQIVWAFSHGVATLGTRAHFLREQTSIEELAVVGCSVLERGMRSA